MLGGPVYVQFTTAFYLQFTNHQWKEKSKHRQQFCVYVALEVECKTSLQRCSYTEQLDI